jgi:peptidoglycan/xylan/chitin deacetylase (PgdA/CDA1 family)
MSAPIERAAADNADDEVDPLADPHADPIDSSAGPDSEPAAEPSAQAEAAPALEPSSMAAAPNQPATVAAASPEAVAEAAPSPAPSPAPVARDRSKFGPPGPPRAAADLPIVMYHHVGPLPPNPDIFRRDLTVAPDLFERTLSQLDERGVQTVTMADLFDHFAGGPALPQRSAILTFDDGYDDVYEYAFPALKKHGMVGTFFIITDFVDRPGYLSWDQIVEMRNAGMEIAAHSSNHPDFTQIRPAELNRQLAEPKAILEDHLGQKIRFMAYPSGKYNAAVMAATRAAGYQAAVTVTHGTHHTPALAFELRRVRARGADSVAEIIARMTPPSWR